MPGHCATWLIGYPELASAPGPYNIIHTFGIYDPALDPTNEGVYIFIDKLIGEMALLFPDEYLHIGGDEVTYKHWKENPRIQAFIQQQKLRDEPGLPGVLQQTRSADSEKAWQEDGRLGRNPSPKSSSRHPRSVLARSRFPRRGRETGLQNSLIFRLLSRPSEPDLYLLLCRSARWTR